MMHKDQSNPLQRNMDIPLTRLRFKVYFCGYLRAIKAAVIKTKIKIVIVFQEKSQNTVA